MLNKLTGKFKKKRKRKKLIFSLKSSPCPYMDHAGMAWGWLFGLSLLPQSSNASVFTWFLSSFSSVSVAFKINLECSCLEMKGLNAIIDDVILRAMLLHRLTHKTPHFYFIFTTWWSPRGPSQRHLRDFSTAVPWFWTEQASSNTPLCKNFSNWWDML